MTDDGGTAFSWLGNKVEVVWKQRDILMDAMREIAAIDDHGASIATCPKCIAETAIDDCKDVVKGELK